MKRRSGGRVNRAWRGKSGGKMREKGGEEMGPESTLQKL